MKKAETDFGQREEEARKFSFLFFIPFEGAYIYLLGGGEEWLGEEESKISIILGVVSMTKLAAPVSKPSSGHL